MYNFAAATEAVQPFSAHDELIRNAIGLGGSLVIFAVLYGLGLVAWRYVSKKSNAKSKAEAKANAEVLMRIEEMYDSNQLTADQVNILLRASIEDPETVNKRLDELTDPHVGLKKRLASNWGGDNDEHKGRPKALRG